MADEGVARRPFGVDLALSVFAPWTTGGPTALERVARALLRHPWWTSWCVALGALGGAIGLRLLVPLVVPATTGSVHGDLIQDVVYTCIDFGWFACVPAALFFVAAHARKPRDRWAPLIAFTALSIPDFALQFILVGDGLAEFSDVRFTALSWGLACAGYPAGFAVARIPTTWLGALVGAVSLVTALLLFSAKVSMWAALVDLSSWGALPDPSWDRFRAQIAAILLLLVAVRSDRTVLPTLATILVMILVAAGVTVLYFEFPLPLALSLLVATLPAVVPLALLLPLLRACRRAQSVTDDAKAIAAF